jgi:tetratricopeptide (TPR) repeat protein
MSAPHDHPERLREWRRELERDASSLAFLPLARACARLGRLEASMRLCIDGLTHHPANAEAHHLLGELYQRAGDPERAFDEWDIALHLDPEHTGARRAIGLLCLQRREWNAATRHLERALAAAPADAEVVRALALVRSRSGDPRAGYAAPEAAAEASTARLIRGIRAPIERFVASVRPDALLIVTGSGKLLGRQGGAHPSLDVTGVAALAAAIRASSRALAGLLGQDGFGHVYLRGAERQVFLGGFDTPAQEMILVVVMRDPSRLGLLRLAFASLVSEILALPEARLPRRALRAETFEEELEAARALVQAGAGMGSSGPTDRGSPGGRA